MPKKIKLIDSKTEKVFSIVGQASEEISGWTEDAIDCVMKINTAVSQINNDISEQKITQEDAAVLMDKTVTKLEGKLKNRIRRMTKNTKAMTGLMSALKAMQDDE